MKNVNIYFSLFFLIFMCRPAAPLLNSNSEKASDPNVEANSHYGKAKASCAKTFTNSEWMWSRQKGSYGFKQWHLAHWLLEDKLIETETEKDGSFFTLLCVISGE